MIRLMLADDHTIIRDGLKKIFSTVPDMQVVAEAADGCEVLALLRAQRRTCCCWTCRCRGAAASC